jgi:ceramide glucosyltransferase
MAPTLSLLRDLLIAGALIGCLYTIVTSIMVVGFGPARRPLAKAPPPVAKAQPPVTILKPLHGGEPGLYARLVAFCRQDYGAPVQLVLGVQAAGDPAADVVRRLQADFRGMPIELAIDTREHGRNRKLSNLINMMPLARYDVLVFSDSDMEVGPGYLAEVVAALDQPGVGAVSSLYHGVAANTPGRLAALAINTQFLPQVVAALRARIAHPCFGATIALRRGMLTRIGGLRAFRDLLADDYEIGAAVREAGYAVAVLPLSIGHVCLEPGLRATLARELRVARTIKLIEPAGYAGTIIAHPFALAALAALAGATDAGLLMAFALACRCVLCASVERTFGLPRQDYWLIPLHDLVAFTIFVASFAGDKVTWRGCRYRIANDGTMAQDPAARLISPHGSSSPRPG